MVREEQAADPRELLLGGGSRLAVLPASRAARVLRTSDPGLLVLALVVGVAAAGFAIAFRWLIRTFTMLFSGHVDYAAAPGSAHPWLPQWGPWFLLGTPVVAGLLYGPLVHFFAREARGHGVPEVMYAVARHGGRIKPRVAAVKALASALCIGGGGSVGREGPIVQIGSALGSTVGRLSGVPEARLRVLVACGAAAGISATFNAPLAGVFFAMELILADFTAQAFGMVVLAAVVSSVIARAALGDTPFLQLPDFVVEHPLEYVGFAVLGLLGGAVGVLFSRVLYWVEDACDWLWRGPEWLRPAAGGVLLGALLLVVPQMYGVGYPVLEDAVHGRYVVGFLLVLLVAKMVATSLTIGIGGSGGVFAPSLFVGAALGAAFGQTLAAVAPEASGPVGAYALIGMGAVFAGAARAPITAVVILFELTGEYGIILPLMGAIALATGLSHAVSSDTVYTRKLLRRGVDLRRGSETVPRSAPLVVDDVMQVLPTPVSAQATLTEVARAFTSAGGTVLPVADEHGTMLGVVTAHGVFEALADGRHDHAAARLVTETALTVSVNDTLEDAAEQMSKAASTAVPVVDHTDTVVGWLDERQLLAPIH